jgi:hypothetical protein
MASSEFSFTMVVRTRRLTFTLTKKRFINDTYFRSTDTDPAINSFAAQNWTSHLGFTETESWRPWTVDNCRRMGGYVTRYERDFDFLTIRGAGHMVRMSKQIPSQFFRCLILFSFVNVWSVCFVKVPAIKAAASFTFMKSWIEGTEYPAYVEDCEAPGSEVGQRPELETTLQE